MAHSFRAPWLRGRGNPLLAHTLPCLPLQLMVFGFFLCLDAFLYVLTLLPLRVCLALFRLLTLPCYGFR